MGALHKLPWRASDGAVHVVVETPRGDRAKFAWDPQLRGFVVAKPLLLGLTYPFDWGFVPSTRAEDGDPADVMVLHDVPTYPGVILPCEVIGVCRVEQRTKKKTVRNDRYLAVPMHSPRSHAVDDARALPEELRVELEKFFQATDTLQDKEAHILAWEGQAEAMRTLTEAAKRFAKK